MTGVQTAIDPETGEIIDVDMVRELYTDTSISGRQVIRERLGLGKMVRVTMLAQVVMVGEELDKDGIKTYVQKLKLDRVEKVERGAI